jgi:hypothetical protein
MAGRLKEGDIAMVVEHSGDCFWTYNLVRVSVNALQLCDGARFGAYTIGVPLEVELIAKQYHKLMSGECMITSEEAMAPVRAAIRAVKDAIKATEQSAEAP